MKWCIRKIIMALISLTVITSTLSACNKQPVKVSYANTVMGTVVQASVYITEEDGKQLTEELRTELERLERECLSWRVEDSLVAEINERAGEEVRLSEELNGYLKEIGEISKKSGGALDITIGNVTRLWDLDTWATLEKEKWQDFSVPKKDVLQTSLQDTGYEKVVLENGRICLPKGMSLDLGAVGKGIACDRVGQILKNNDCIKGAVVSVGGSVITYGTKPDGSAWNVAIVHPREEGEYLGMLSLQGEWYVSSSGDYERYVEKNGKRYHHIMNPKDGYPADAGLCSVTILSDRGLVSDALSTACFVLGKEKGMDLVREMGVEALFVTTETEVFMTEGMKKYFKEK